MSKKEEEKPEQFVGKMVKFEFGSTKSCIGAETGVVRAVIPMSEDPRRLIDELRLPRGKIGINDMTERLLITIERKHARTGAVLPQPRVRAVPWRAGRFKVVEPKQAPAVASDY